jgi:hypothetical protein
MREAGHGHGSITGRRPRGRLSAPLRGGRTRATQSRLTAQDVYAFWIAGFVLLCIVVGLAMRQPQPQLRLPRPNGAQVSTMLAWLIIAVVVIVVLLTHAK